MAISEILYTKDQLSTIMRGWGCKQSLPKKGENVIVCWPKPANPNVAVITKSGQKSTYGKPLFLCRMGMDHEMVHYDRPVKAQS